MSEEDDGQLAVLDRISDVLMLLSEVSTSSFYSRLPDLPEKDMFHVLYRAINEMVEALGAAHERAERYRQELEEKLATIEQQRLAIRELSTPVIEVWEGVLCLPVVGVMDTTRSSEMTETLLRAVVERRARCAIIDVTGIEVMDTATADHFLRMTKAVRLLGADCVVTGISPSIAQTVVHMGVDLTDVRTHGSLRDALMLYSARAANQRPGAAFARTRAGSSSGKR